MPTRHPEGAAWYRAVFDQATVGIARVAPDGRFLEVNDCFCTIVGHSRERLMRGDFQQITHPDDLEADLANVARLVSGAASSYAMEKRYVRPDGTLVWAALHVALVRDADGRPTNFVSVVKDITQTKDAEHRLKANTARLEALSHQLLTVQEEERRRLARELHDQIGQQLAGLKLSLEALRLRYDVLAAEPRMTDSLELIDQTIAQVGDTSLDLRPSMLDDLGLEAALRAYARRQQTRSACTIVVRGTVPGRLSESVETATFRVVQEAVRNAITHGRSRTVDIELLVAPTELTVTIRDDGVGFDDAAPPSTPHGSGMGLLSMRERVELLAGVLTVQSTVGAGTTIRVRIPL